MYTFQHNQISQVLISYHLQFHIHVNRFQVKEMGSELSVEKYPVLKELMDFDENVWRDTVVVPPMGRARIFVQFKEYTGKTVFHCHFLGTCGIIQNLTACRVFIV